MKRYILGLLTSLISFSGVCQNAQEDSIRKVVIAFQQDFNEGSFKNADNYTTADWEHVNPTGGITKGRDEVLKEVRQVHQTFLKGVTITLESMTIRFIADDVAIANVTQKGSTFETPDGVKHDNPRSFNTYIIVRQKGKWLLTHDQSTPINKL